MHETDRTIDRIYARLELSRKPNCEVILMDKVPLFAIHNTSTGVEPRNKCKTCINVV